MKVKVKQAFRDKFNTSRVFKPGEVLDFEEERAQNIVRLGLADPLPTEPEQETQKKPRSPRKKSK